MRIITFNVNESELGEEVGQYKQFSPALADLAIGCLFPNLSKYITADSDYSLIHGLTKLEIQDYFQSIQGDKSKEHTKSVIEIFSNVDEKSKMISLLGGKANKILAIINKSNRKLTFVK